LPKATDAQLSKQKVLKEQENKVLLKLVASKSSIVLLLAIIQIIQILKELNV